MNSLEGKVVSEIVRHFKVLRLKKAVSQGKLAARAGVTRPAISQIESGKRIPTLVVCLKIAHALDEKFSDIIAQFE